MAVYRLLRCRATGAFRHAPALGLLAVALALGVLAADGYGLAHDQQTQHRVGLFTVEYVLGENTKLLGHNLRYYGAVFEVAMLAVERALGLADIRHVYLCRYLLSHGFFLVGAFACYLLAHRLFGSRALALLAMLFFLCHPRLYGHSFFNSKDTPFLAMFMIALLLAHWTLRRAAGKMNVRGVGAFAALGAWLGLISSVRPMAFLLVVLVGLARCADLFAAPQRERAPILAGVGAMTLLSGAGFFAGLPYLWGDPFVRVAEWFALMADHTHVVNSLFLGELISTNARPFSYVPVWIGITTPPFVVVLALLGGVALCTRLAGRARRWQRARESLCDPALRFQMLLAASALIPVVVVTFWVGSIYNGWRHLYFVYGPLCLGAVGGLAWFCRNAGAKLAVLGRVVATLGLVPVMAWTARLHPHEHVYFNFLVDRKTPERLRTQFDLDYWSVPLKEALQVLLDAYPGRVAVTGTIADSKDVLTAEQRRRVVRSNDFSAHFATDYRYWWGEGGEEGPIYVRPLHVRHVFANTLYAIARLQVNIGREGGANGRRHLADYRAALSSPPMAVAPFNVHWQDDGLTYLRDNCQPEHVEGMLFAKGPKQRGRFFLQIAGDKENLPGPYLHNKDFQFRHRGVVLKDGRSRICMARVALPDFEVDVIRTGQLDADGTPLWRREIGRADAALLGRALARVRAAAPAANGPFRIHIDGGALVYEKGDCTEADRASPFFVHVVPFQLADIPASVAPHGFVNRGFSFATHGAVVDGTCVARTRLPPFRVREVRTGQFDPGKGELWRAELVLAPAGV